MNQPSRIFHHTPWQQYHQNGEVMEGMHGDSAYFKNPTHIMGAVHVWLWRRSAVGVEILLQHRSKELTSWPDRWDISAAGHIDAGESVVQAATRETREEIGVDIISSKLVYIFSLRTPLKSNEIDHVFLYEVDETLVLNYADGEVDETRWMSLDDYQEVVKNPESAKMINQGEGYFRLFIDNLKSVAGDN